MGVESYLVLWVFTDECCHPNRFRVELMLIESFEIGRLDFPNRDTLKSIHCFLPNDQAQRLPPETPGWPQESLTNYPNRPTAQRGGGSLQRHG
jgi:hypothetical protein